METAAQQITDYIERFRRGDRDGAFFSLLEMEHGILPQLMELFRQELDGQVREFLVEVIWQHRQPSVIPFLGEVLNDSEPLVWRQALDGLVTMASPASLEALRNVRLRQQTGEILLWLDKAIHQVESEIGGHK